MEALPQMVRPFAHASARLPGTRAATSATTSRRGRAKQRMSRGSRLVDVWSASKGDVGDEAKAVCGR